NPHPTIFRVAATEDRTREDRDLVLANAGLPEDVVPEPATGPLVESCHLGRAIGEVERVLIGDLGLVETAPVRVRATDKVTAVEIVVEIELLADLRFDRHATVERPDIVLALDVLGFLPVDIDPHEHCDPARFRQHHREVLIIQTTIDALFDREHIRAHAANRPGRRYREPLDDCRVVALAPREYRGRRDARLLALRLERRLDRCLDAAGRRLRRTPYALQIPK